MSRRPRSAPPHPTGAGRRPGAWVVFAAAAPCLPFLSLLLGGETLWFRDFSLYFVPMKSLVGDLWREGSLPLWDPYVRNGMPLLANPQTGVFYPPTALLVLFGVNPGITLFVLLHLAAAGAGFYLFTREARLPPPAALLGAVGFGLGGYLASLINVLNNLQAAVWVPWVLLFAMRLRARGDRSSWTGLTLALALALLGGEMQLAALGLSTAAALVATLGTSLVSDRPVTPTPQGANGSSGPLRKARETLRTQALIGLAAGAAACLIAVQLLPTAELLGESVRRGGLPFELAADYSLDPPSLFSLAFPRPSVPGDSFSGAPVTEDMPWLLSIYGGAALVPLAFTGAFGRRRRWTIFWIVAGTAGVLLALGSHSAVFRIAYDAVPPFRSFRYPEKFLLLSALALPSLAAAGVERILAGEARLREIVLGCVAVAISGTGALLRLEETARYRPWEAAVHGALAALAVAGIVLLTRSAKVNARSAAGILCVIAVVDLGWAARAVNPTVPWRFYERPWAAGVLEEAGADPQETRIRSTPLSADMEGVAVVSGARVFSNHYLFGQSLAPNLGQMHGWLHQDGMAGIETRGTADLIDALIARDPRTAMRMLRLASVGYMVTSLPLPQEDVSPIATHRELPVAVVRVRAALPRAYLAEDWSVAAEPRAALERAIAADFRPRREVVLERAPSFAASGIAPGAGVEGKGNAAPMIRAVWDHSAARFDVTVPRPMVLVVTDTYYPGWRATLDGREVPLLRANGYGRAVAVPAGRHRIEQVYRPASFTRGAAISIASAILLAGLTCLPRRRADHASWQGAGSGLSGEASPMQEDAGIEEFGASGRQAAGARG